VLLRGWASVRNHAYTRPVDWRSRAQWSGTVSGGPQQLSMHRWRQPWEHRVDRLHWSSGGGGDMINVVQRQQNPRAAPTEAMTDKFCARARGGWVSGWRVKFRRSNYGGFCWRSTSWNAGRILHRWQECKWSRWLQMCAFQNCNVFYTKMQSGKLRQTVLNLCVSLKVIGRKGKNVNWMSGSHTR